jgi:hypothetical protein
MSSAYNDTDKKSEDNAAKLAVALLKKYNLGIEKLYTHTHWLNVRDGKTGTVDQLNTMKNSYKMCPLYILPHWSEFKAKVQDYLNATTITLNNATLYASATATSGFCLRDIIIPLSRVSSTLGNLPHWCISIPTTIQY